MVTQRSEKMKLPLKWEFPGGKIEINETAEECLHRELKEELNIEVRILKNLVNKPYNYGEFTINLIPFLSIYESGEITLSEHKAFKWLLKEELAALDWAPADVPIVEELLKLVI
ncbi:MAG: mismatch repair protein MutT [Bacteroidetes bacterium]|nr:mismatch repair protein MutT [Bacteroidota bacterium]